MTFIPRSNFTCSSADAIPSTSLELHPTADLPMTDLVNMMAFFHLKQLCGNCNYCDSWLP